MELHPAVLHRCVEASINGELLSVRLGEGQGKIFSPFSLVSLVDTTVADAPVSGVAMKVKVTPWQVILSSSPGVALACTLLTGGALTSGSGIGPNATCWMEA